MYKIDGGKEFLYQWDINQRIIVLEDTVDEVHFNNRISEEALIVEVYTENGNRYANIPNILLQEDWAIKVYMVSGDYVKEYDSIVVNGRVKPADYVYEETEVKNYEELEKRIAALEQNTIDLSEYATKSYVSDAIGAITDIDLEDYYTKEEVETYVADAIEAEQTKYYTKEEVEGLIDGVEVDLSGYYTKGEVEGLIDGVEVDLSGYYTKGETDALIGDISSLLDDINGEVI